ncbi:ImuA family protein [Neorhodopirellula lusitana]|uniref:ImuA family protein n=1 Tax=Neorhodopirellula lusitana TaxID=445327 RepID=UPI003850193F
MPKTIATSTAPSHQQTFEFWQPAETSRSRHQAKTQTKPQSQESKARAAGTSGAKRKSKRTQHWADVTVATLRRAASPAFSALPSSQPAHPNSGVSPAAASATGTAKTPRDSLLADLRNRAAAISASPAMETAETFSTGSSTLDHWLPGGGLKRGQICEWVCVGGAGRAGDAGGAGTLAMLATAQAIADQSGPVIVVDPNENFYAAGAIACGIPAERIVWCRCDNQRDCVWTLDQALRCRAVAAVWSMLPWHLNDRDARRLQLAAEQGRTPGLLTLPSSSATRPSFAPNRFEVVPERTGDTASRQSETGNLSTFVRPGVYTRPTMDSRKVRVRLNGSQHATFAITHDARLQTLTDSAASSKVAASNQATQPPRSPQDARHAVQRSRAAESAEIRATDTRPAEAKHSETIAVSLAARLANPASTRPTGDSQESSQRRTG